MPSHFPRFSSQSGNPAILLRGESLYIKGQLELALIMYTRLVQLTKFSGHYAHRAVSVYLLILMVCLYWRECDVACRWIHRESTFNIHIQQRQMSQKKSLLL